MFLIVIELEKNYISSENVVFRSENLKTDIFTSVTCTHSSIIVGVVHFVFTPISFLSSFLFIMLTSNHKEMVFNELSPEKKNG